MERRLVRREARGKCQAGEGKGKCQERDESVRQEKTKRKVSGRRRQECHADGKRKVSGGRRRECQAEDKRKVSGGRRRECQAGEAKVTVSQKWVKGESIGREVSRVKNKTGMGGGSREGRKRQ